MRRWLWVVALLIAWITSGCAANPTLVRRHPDLAGAASRIGSIAILAPEVEQQRLAFGGANERLPDRERSIARELIDGLRARLAAKHYMVLANDEDEWPGDAKKEESAELRQLRVAGREVIERLYGPKATADATGAVRVSVGPAALPVARQMQADALLLVGYAGFEKSKGQRAADFATSVLFGSAVTVATGGLVIPVEPAARSGGAIMLVLIDGSSGDVLWANRVSGSTDGRASGPAWSRRARGGLGSLVHAAVREAPEGGRAMAEQPGDAAMLRTTSTTPH
jgi:hypothetical protein